jgi:hypothetical protein
LGPANANFFTGSAYLANITFYEQRKLANLFHVSCFTVGALKYTASAIIVPLPDMPGQVLSPDHKWVNKAFENRDSVVQSGIGALTEKLRQNAWPSFALQLS